MSSDRFAMGKGRGTGRHRPRGYTLAELLVALAVASVFLLGVVAAFLQILRASDRSEKTMQATQNARAAIETMALFIKPARIEPTMPSQYFIGVNSPTMGGDRIDNDRDGRVDEEQPDGLDNDGDFNVLIDDRHATFGGVAERRLFVGQADLGDVHVDEDTVFHRDQLTYATFPISSVSGSRDELTSFSIGSFEGENHVLLHQVMRTTGTSAGVVQLAPLAYDVLSLNILYWDPNASPPYWVESWDTLTSQSLPAPGIELPAAVYISVTVYAGRKPLDQVGPMEPIETVTVSTVINLEAIIQDPRYESQVRPNL